MKGMLIQLGGFLIHPSSLILHPLFLAEGAGFELAWAVDSPSVFETGAIPFRRTLLDGNLKVRTGALRFELRSTMLETVVFAVYTMLLCDPGKVHAVGLAPTKSHGDA
jgi:hypothetical protein